MISLGMKTGERCGWWSCVQLQTKVEQKLVAAADPQAGALGFLQSAHAGGLTAVEFSIDGIP